MPYEFQITGLSDAVNVLDDYEDLFKKTTQELNDISLPIPNLGISLKVTGLDKVKKPFVVLEKQIKKAHTKAVRLLAEELSKALDEAMESSVWNWTSDTRDIVDTGELKKSKKIVVTSDSDIHIFYGTDYAAIVHYGGYFNPYGNQNAKMFYPGRPWVTSLIEGGGPIDRFDFGKIYSAFLLAELNSLI